MPRPVGYDEIVARALSGWTDAVGCRSRSTSARPPVRAGAGLELRVVDHGRGLPKKAIDRVFVPFQRLGDRDNTTGVGLGLSAAKGFVDAMGGGIRTEDASAAA